MKTFSLLLAILLVSVFTTYAQNQKCLASSNQIIQNAGGKIQSQAIDVNDIYCIKAEIPSTSDLEKIKTICDTTVKTTKVSYTWRLNYDKNYEKEYLINGSRLLVTIYLNDKFLFFEFPNK